MYSLIYNYIFLIIDGNDKYILMYKLNEKS